MYCKWEITLEEENLHVFWNTQQFVGNTRSSNSIVY